MRNQALVRKENCFEFFVLCLENWKKEEQKTYSPFSKLQLHKLLFLASSINSTNESHEMLDIFNEFYALKYGPVEIEIYNSMTENSFKNIWFEGNDCITEKLSEDKISITNEDKTIILKAVNDLRSINNDYVNMTPFQLVDITHQWTAWKIAYEFAELCNVKRERMTEESIINSAIKTF